MDRSRREALRLLAALPVVGLAGCISALRGTTRETSTRTVPSHEQTDVPPTPTTRPFPEPPDSLTEQAVRRYVAGYERAVVHNEAVRGGARQVELDCAAIIDLVTDHGVYAYGACAGSWSGGGEHADVLFPQTPYFVADSRTVRLGDEAIRRLERPTWPQVYGNDDGESDIGPAKLSVYNFDTVDHSHRVRVRRTDIEDTPQVYDESWDLPAEHGVVHDRVTMESGQYRVQVSRENGRTAQTDWEVTAESEAPWSLVIYITPRGTFRISRPQLGIEAFRSQTVTETGS